MKKILIFIKSSLHWVEDDEKTVRKNLFIILNGTINWWKESYDRKLGLKAKQEYGFHAERKISKSLYFPLLFFMSAHMNAQYTHIFLLFSAD